MKALLLSFLCLTTVVGWSLQRFGRRFGSVAAVVSEIVADWADMEWACPTLR
jgi:hypothetical protein